MVLQASAHGTPVRPGFWLQFDPLQPVKHPARHFFMQPGRYWWRHALPAGDSCRGKCGRSLCRHVFIVIFHRQACPEYIDRVFKRLLQNPFSNLANRLPSQCAVCRSWPAAPVCRACMHRFAVNRPRCRCCALALADGLSTGLQARADICLDCIRQPPPLDATLAALDYAYPWSALISAYKFGEQPGWAPFFAGLLLKTPGVRLALDNLQAVDLILPVPLSKERLQTRGFNQAWLLAKELVRHVGSTAQADSSLLLRVKNTRPQTELKREARLANVKGAFQLDPLRAAGVKGRRILLVDDVMTSGASLFTAAEVLRAAGAAQITGIVLARTPQ